MSDKKILKVDVNDFMLSNNTSRKKKSTKQNGEIKVKQPTERKKNETLKKKSILKMIRQHQEERYKKLFENNNSKPTESNNSNSIDNFNKDFDEAKKYLQDLTEKTDTANRMKNYTLFFQIQTIFFISNNLKWKGNFILTFFIKETTKTC